MTASSVAAFLTAATAICALIAAIASWRTATATRKAAVGPLVNDLLKEYKTVGMRDAIRRLRRRGGSNPEQWVETWWQGLSRQDPEALLDEDARYLINGFFNRIADLMEAELLTEDALRILVRQRGIAIWYRVVEPMTAKHDADVADSPFEALRERWRRYGRSGLQAVPGRFPADSV